MEHHVRTMAPDNELMGKFGTLDFDEIKKQIQEDYNRIRAVAEKEADPAKALARVEKNFNKDIRTMQAMWEKLRGMYKQPDDYSAPLEVAGRFGLALNFARLLGDFVMSSLPDLARPAMVHGVQRAYGDIIAAAITDFKGLKIAAGEMVEIGTAIDLTNSATALKRFHIDDYVSTANRVDRVGIGIANAAANLSGANLWNSTLKTYAGIVTQNRMMRAIQSLGAGKKIPEKELENLASHFIDPAMAKRIAKQFAEHGESRRTLRIANAREWTDIEAKNLFQAAIKKQVDELIVTPGLDRPLWMEGTAGRVVSQFKSFSFVSTQRTTLAAMQQGDAHAAQGMLLAVFLGSQVYAWKQMMSGREISDDPRVWITEGIDRSGIAGWAMEVNNMVEKASRGTIGVNAMIGGPPMSRYAARNITGALLGPSVGTVQDIFTGTGAAISGDFSESDVKAIRRLLPGQNIPYLRGIFDQIEAGANSALGTN